MSHLFPFRRLPRAVAILEAIKLCHRFDESLDISFPPRLSARAALATKSSPTFFNGWLKGLSFILNLNSCQLLIVRHTESGNKHVDVLCGLICLLKLVWHIDTGIFNIIFMKLSKLAKQTSSTIENGSPDLEITSAAGLDIAGEGDVTFLANPKYTPQIESTKAAAIFLNEGAK